MKDTPAYSASEMDCSLEDFHTLFDRGYITVDKNLNVEVSHRIKVDFRNGKEYYARHGSKLIICISEKNNCQIHVSRLA